MYDNYMHRRRCTCMLLPVVVLFCMCVGVCRTPRCRNVLICVWSPQLRTDLLGNQQATAAVCSSILLATFAPFCPTALKLLVSPPTNRCIYSRSRQLTPPVSARRRSRVPTVASPRQRRGVATRRVSTSVTRAASTIDCTGYVPVVHVVMLPYHTPLLPSGSSPLPRLTFCADQVKFSKTVR